MIIVRLVGGLGNQLFQYALGRHLSIINKQDLKIDISGYAGNFPDPEKGIRVYGLANFNIATVVATKEDMRKFSVYKGSNLITRIIRKINRMRNYLDCSYMVESSEIYYRFQPNLLNMIINKDIYLEGYWQTEKYFRDIKDVIRKDFTFKNEPDEFNKELIKKMSEENSVAIHIRHGDNANAYAKAHGVLPKEYYEKAAQILIEKICDLHFYVFSDDPEWSRENLKLNYQTEYISHNGDGKNHEDLRLMSSCKHHIIGNSTFSWWGAWLGEKPGQVVIAPKVYHIGKDISKTDFYPESWILI